mgnify:CR=1 FL=1
MNNDKNREKMIALLKKLEHKEIDQDTFNREYEKLTTSEEFIQNIKQTNRIDLSNLKTPICIIFFVFVIPFIIYLFISPYIGRPYTYVKDYNNINEPIQTPTTGTINTKIDGVNIEIDLKYEYTIKGRVLDTYHYLPTTLTNKLSPVDVGIAWGYILNDDTYDHVKCHESGARYLYCHSKGDWIDNTDGLYSNNHLIPSNKKIKKLMKKMRKGDMVQIEGYLVYVYWEKGNRQANWQSSTTREDTGDGACEIIYVTDIKWLKAKK